MTMTGFKNPYCMVTGVLLTILLSASPPRAWSIEQDNGEEPFTPVISYSSNIFSHLIKENAEAAAKLWSTLVIRKKNGIAETKIFYSRSELEKDLRTEKVDLVVLLSNEYLEMKNRTLMEPLFISEKNHQLYDSFILLVRKDSGIRTVKALKGKIFILQKGAPSDIHKLWLETLMMKEGVRKPERYFSSLRETMSPSQALMPVFFNQADACIVSRRTLDVMAELNPQLRRDLTVVEETAPFATGIIAVRRGYSPRLRAKLKKVLETLDQDVQGRQLLTLFRMSRLVPFRHAYLESMESFLKNYNDLKTSKEQSAP